MNPAGCEILTTAEMALADQITIRAGTPGVVLMENAGQAVANKVAVLLGGDQNRVAILCGPGNNGGDGLVAARLLDSQGFRVSLALLGDVSALKGDAAQAAARWNGPVEPLTADGVARLLEKADLVVDALLGAGLSRDLDGAALAAVEAMNEWRRRTGRPVVAVDIPSGIDGNDGSIRGAAVEADSTVTFFRLKPGHLLLPGRVNCGAVDVADIGIAASALSDIAPKTFVNCPTLWRDEFARPVIAGHKYQRGHAGVVGGGLAHAGAARLAARGAIRIGAGLVTLCSPRQALLVQAAHLTAIMVRPCDGADELREFLGDSRITAVVLGPGGGISETTREFVAAVLSPRVGSDGSRPAVVLDADALTSFAGEASRLADLIAAAQGPVVLTPHEGEFARLFNADGAALEAHIEGKVAKPPPSKLERARAAARFLGATIILKGADTVVAHPDGRAAIAADDAPWLATAGSGDVLAGFVAGLLAQRMPAFEAACAAVWLHAGAARQIGLGLIAEDLPEALPKVLRELFNDGARRGIQGR